MKTILSIAFGLPLFGEFLPILFVLLAGFGINNIWHNGAKDFVGVAICKLTQAH